MAETHNLGMWEVAAPIRHLAAANLITQVGNRTSPTGKGMAKLWRKVPCQPESPDPPAPQRRMPHIRLSSDQVLARLPEGPFTARQLAAVLGCSHVTAGKHIDRLCDEGHAGYVGLDLSMEKVPPRPPRIFERNVGQWD